MISERLPDPGGHSGGIIAPQVMGLVQPHLTLNVMVNFGLGMLFLTAGFEMDPAVLSGRPTAGRVLTLQKPAPGESLGHVRE
jgi:hypothetical protein